MRARRRLKKLTDLLKLHFIAHNMSLIKFKGSIGQKFLTDKFRQTLKMLALGITNFCQTTEVVGNFGVTLAIIMINENNTSNLVSLGHGLNMLPHGMPVFRKQHLHPKMAGHTRKSDDHGNVNSKFSLDKCPESFLESRVGAVDNQSVRYTFS